MALPHSLPQTLIMFTSRSIMFALLSFLAGANACIQCPASIEVDGSVADHYLTLPNDQYTICIYYNDQLPSGETCRYGTVSAFWILRSSLFSVTC
ncbi:uncharacterized protein EDB91DRAFT_160688 [Suillus paluster]|uniref:uncharacterized protein n=1 Tax=Suillus paluster TaxID=48578 RepID=UPI001B865B9C|nr:uncharacterized protein EDB91DRAFT_160688 [Suillus paluster]KAG1723725.1 hypothetical protein EDB91DRAFT_160688 [Suillus paluster]